MSNLTIFLIVVMCGIASMLFAFAIAHRDPLGIQGKL
jgi:hypothetical protein